MAVLKTATRLDSPGSHKVRRAQRLVAARPTPARGADEVSERSSRTARDRARPRDRSDGSGYLSLYFKDLQGLDVLRPEQEFATAREIEALELALWESLLGFAPAHALVLAALDDAGAHAATLDALRRRPGSRARARCAAELREHDLDKLWSDAVVDRVQRARRGGVAGAAGPDAGLARARGFAEWAQQVAAADRAVHAARNEFVKANLRLVISIARRFNHGRMSLADLVQEGNLGLMKAVERYDYRRGFRFSTYASWWIRHAISRALADKGREIRLPVHMIDAQHRLGKARRALTSKLGRAPTSEELAEATQLPLEKIENMRLWVLEQSVSLDRPVGDEDGRVLAEVLEDPDGGPPAPADGMAMEALTAEVRALLRSLRPIEADILRRRFGFDDDEEATLKEIGSRYGLSRERIRQLQEQALDKLRRALERRELV